MRNIVSLYIDKYNIRDVENEEKRIRALVKKIHEEGSVFCDFPFDYMMEDEQLVLLHYIMTSLPERQIIANMKKIDVDRYYMNFAYQSDISKSMTKIILDNDPRIALSIDLEMEIRYSRGIIRNLECDIKDVLKSLLKTNECIIDNYMQEKQLLLLMGLGKHNTIYIFDYIKYVADVVLQLLIYRFMNENEMKFLDVMKILSEKVDEMEDSIEKQLRTRKDQWIRAKQMACCVLSAETTSEIFSAYITHRSWFYEELNIKKVLKEEMLNCPSMFEEVPTEFKAEKILITGHDVKLYEKIITEGQHIDAYKKKLETVKLFIDIMNKYGGRMCYSICLQDLKVYFREIFVSKSSYKKRMTPRIVKEYIDQVALVQREQQPIPQFNKQSQYIFVREKISRGYFREKGLSRQYVHKIDFESKLYYLLLKLYLFYDVYDSLEFTYEVNHNLLKTFESQLGQ